MGGRLGRTVVHFGKLPIKLLTPTNTSPAALSTIREIALKTVPSASKIEIRRVLESLYGLDVAEVRTLNMEGKKRRGGGLLIAKPDYKKAYVTLHTPLSLALDLFPIRLVSEERERSKQQAQRQDVVVGEGGEGKGRHWLDGDDGRGGRGRRGEQRHSHGRRAPGQKERKTAGRGGHGGGGGKVGLAVANEETSRFPWSSMRSWS